MSGRHFPTGRMNHHQMDSGMQGNPQRNDPRESSSMYARNSGGRGTPIRNRGGMGMNSGGNMHSMNMHPSMHMDPMMDYGGMMDLGPDPYNVGGPPFMPMHPADAAMGMGMDQMMDFPPPRFVPPHMRRGQRQPRIESQGHMGEMLDHSPLATSSPHMSRMHSPHSSIPGTMMAPPSMVTMLTADPYQNKPKRNKRAASSNSFPSKLYAILADPAYKEYIAWLPHGRAWRVLKPKAFEELVIPKFFRSDRYASFMRQVNGWGFKRITEGPDLNAYYHEMFLRGLPHVCAKMRRPLKGQSAAARELGQSPDFYKISKFAPLPPPKAPPKSGSPHMMQDNGKTDEMTDLAKTKSPGVVSRDEMPPTQEMKHEQEGDVKKESDNDNNNGNKTMDMEPKSPVPQDHENKATVNLSSPSSLGSIEAAQLRGMMAATGGMPPSPESKVASPGGGAVTSQGGYEFASASNSITSWQDPSDHELMWGNTNAHPPVAYADEGMHHPSHHHNMGQVTPPRSSGAIRMGGGSNMQLQSPHGEESDTSGLSVADLCYLTQQNHILMDQSTKRTDV